jgi:hypothetical protein
MRLRGWLGRKALNAAKPKWEKNPGLIGPPAATAARQQTSPSSDPGAGGLFLLPRKPDIATRADGKNIFRHPIDILTRICYNEKKEGNAMPNTEKPKRKTVTSTAVKRRYNEKVYARIYADLPKQLVSDFKAATVQNGATTAGIFRRSMEQFLSEHPPAQS